ncbi:hypothetical protein [Pseudoclavibacter sp. VKM Ac-2888]|uniref:hypothetical protein n=1 Tax=Pseudoclavibacter sp. VKM Ac-2888 TaxID=2783830 RepID=UPI00188C9952|nr:hypothetical protein [Pseudoclavibacter sp. VKM Ac-2888]MBF4552308.1 hypothetical protein [Pseudoclavibacter sp. VKM Ac-2888]
MDREAGEEAIPRQEGLPLVCFGVGLALADGLQASARRASHPEVGVDPEAGVDRAAGVDREAGEEAIPRQERLPLVCFGVGLALADGLQAIRRRACHPEVGGGS